jgi:pimeloyl-ACP methyl ester carboxylesterase
VREFDNEGPRADGAPVVWAGQDEGPALVVIDPSGAAKHDELPATWDRLARHFQVAWCRVPASEHSLEEVEDVLETLAERQTPATIVASGAACPAAMAIAHQFADLVTTVLLVDPVGDTLADTDFEVRVVARSHPGPSDRVEAPMPLGHPEVVEGIVSALAGIT